MSYQVIARKYRPQRFEDVVGQDHVIVTLANAIRAGRIAHAYLFCGPRGTGKTTIARIFAKALNCTDGPSPTFSEDDPRCREITEGRALDVLEIDGASNNGVEQVRELRDTARFAPASSRFKIYIIDEVHMLTTAAFNALLKTLEEPPAHVKFLFATTDPEKVIPTILSRCQRFDLRRIPTSLIVRHLGEIARAEGVSISDPALQAIARGADGGMRDAESTLDQLISFCGLKIEESDVLSMFGLAARQQILDLSRAILQSETTVVLRELDALARNGKDLGRLLNDLLHHFRNLLVYQVSNQDLGLLEVSEAEATELSQQISLAPPDAVTRVLEVLSSAEGRLREATARKIFLEVTFLKAIQARNSVSIDTVLQQLQSLRETNPDTSTVPPERGGAVTPEPRTSRPEVTTQDARPDRPRSSPAGGPPAPVSPVVPSSPAVTRTAPATPADPSVAWEQVVATASPMTRASLQAGVYQGCSNGVLTVGFLPAHDHYRTLLESDRARKAALEAKLAEFGCAATLRWVALAGNPEEKAAARAADPSSTAPSSPPATTRSPASPAAPVPASAPSAPSPAPPRARKTKAAPIKVDPAEFKNDPLIKEALEIFRGQLVDVRAPQDDTDN